VRVFKWFAFFLDDALAPKIGSIVYSADEWPLPGDPITTGYFGGLAKRIDATTDN